MNICQAVWSARSTICVAHMPTYAPCIWAPPMRCKNQGCPWIDGDAIGDPPCLKPQYSMMAYHEKMTGGWPTPGKNISQCGFSDFGSAMSTRSLLHHVHRVKNLNYNGSMILIENDTQEPRSWNDIRLQPGLKSPKCVRNFKTQNVKQWDIGMERATTTWPPKLDILGSGWSI